MTINDEANVRANIGINDSANHANSVDPYWVNNAVDAICEAAEKENGNFTIEMLRGKCCHIPAPPDLRAWGSVTRKAIKLGMIKATGGFALASSSNNSPKPLYVYNGNIGENNV